MAIHFVYLTTLSRAKAEISEWRGDLINRLWFNASDVHSHIYIKGHIMRLLAHMWEWQSLPITNYMFFFHSYNLRNNHIIVCISPQPLTREIYFSSSYSQWFNGACRAKPHIPNVNYLTISLLLSSRRRWENWSRRKMWKEIIN
jgi:hypothetical protein